MSSSFFAKLALLTALAGTAARAQATILPLGDSITESCSGYAGYRYFLWKGLDRERLCADFVGGRYGVACGQPLFPDFDQQHAGYSGFSAVWVALLMQWFPTSVPPTDIALVHLGTNDIVLPVLMGKAPDLDAAFDAMVDIVAGLRARNRSVRIAIAQILPIDPSAPLAPTAHTYVPIWNRAYLPRLLLLSTAASPIVLVDQNTGFDPRAHSRDGVHPNDAGAALIADRWLAALIANDWVPSKTACVATLAPGCVSGSGRIAPPRLEVSTPRAGGTVTVQLSNAPASTAVTALVVGCTESGTPLSWDGCPLHPSVDLVLLRTMMGRAASRDATFTLQLPSWTPPGMQVYLQAVTFGTLGVDQTTSNGVQLLLY